MADWIAAVVPAAGRGVRMGAGVPKQFLTLGGVPLLVHSLQTFEAAHIISEIILVVPQDDCQYCREDIVLSYGLKKVSQVIAGGLVTLILSELPWTIATVSPNRSTKNASSVASTPSASPC